jgi:hypothetical protein
VSALYGRGMHDFVLREIEIGYRAACCEDAETSCGFTALDDIAMQRDMDAERRRMKQSDRTIPSPANGGPRGLASAGLMENPSRQLKCDCNCGAYFDPETPEEMYATIKHYQGHTVKGGCPACKYHGSDDFEPREWN